MLVYSDYRTRFGSTIANHCRTSDVTIEKSWLNGTCFTSLPYKSSMPMRQLYLLLALTTGFVLAGASGGAAANINLAIHQAAEEISTQLSQDDVSVGLIPLTSNEINLNTTCEILTRMLAVQ
ncbi:MAG: hypothetical protein OXT74_05415, partial [Candidatus Poribacteria bacterium]|nr:hypothetical protein [Candidatus Poribacteria bacterium]